MSKNVQYTAPYMKSEWMDREAVRQYIQMAYRIGFALLETKKTKKYLFFGPRRYKVTLVSTYEALQAKKQEILGKTEDYEVLGEIENCVALIKQHGFMQIN